MSEPDFSRLSEYWPNEGDRLLKRGRDVHLVGSSDERLYRLRLGYKSAANFLLQIAMEDSFERRNLIYPAIYCYRHYVELSLKALIAEHGPKSGFLPDTKHHRLNDLWKDFKILLNRLGQSDQDDLSVTEQLIVDLDSIDPDATAFRFATDGKNKPIYLPPDGIDLLNLSEVALKLANFLECADLALTYG